MNRTLHMMLSGLSVTAQIAVGGLIFALVVGLFAGLSASSPRAWLRWPARTHIEIFRGTSALVQLFWFYYVVPQLLGIYLHAMVAGIMVLGLNISAYLAEVVRGALLSVPSGQKEAARALGFTPLQTLWRITLPQAVPHMLPPWGNLTIELTKGTALVSLITLPDLMYNARQLTDHQPNQAIWFYLVVAAFYGLLCLVLVAPVKILERQRVLRATGRTLLSLGKPIAFLHRWTSSIPYAYKRTAMILGAIVAVIASAALLGTLGLRFLDEWDQNFVSTHGVLAELLGPALGKTLTATGAGGLLAILLGMLWAGLRSIPLFGRLLRWILEAIRTTPLLTQLFLIFYGVLPLLGLTFNPLLVGVLVLGVHYSTYTAEVYRSGIEAIPSGQREAALSLGFSRLQTFTRIIIPQAIPRVIPALGNYVVALLKETPLLSAITVIELLGKANEIRSDHFRGIEALTIVGIIFLITSLLAAFLIRMCERILPVRHA